MSRPRKIKFAITLKNGDVFKGIFGLTPTEIWAMTEEEFLEWRNSNYKPIDIKVKGYRKCKRCKNLADRVIDIDNKDINVHKHQDERLTHCFGIDEFMKEYERLYGE